jgi:conjugal transfer pilus assembly protein TraW
MTHVTPISDGLRRTVSSVALFLCCSLPVSAEDLGVVGPVYPIAEQDMLATIETRLHALEKSGEFTRIEKDAKARYQAYTERPVGVSLPRAKATRVWHVDPTLVVPYTIQDNEGRIIYPAGTRVNPLARMTLSKRLLFFDANDPDQCVWTKALLDRDGLRVKAILTNGPVLALMRTWQVRLYFDQRGTLIEHFGIMALPAIVSQDGLQLKVEEVHLEGNG